MVVEQHPALIKLCECCPYDDCINTSRGCKPYNDVRSTILAGEQPPEPEFEPVERKQRKPRSQTRSRHYQRKGEPVAKPPPLPDEVPASPPNPDAAQAYSERSLLMLYNLAIDALEKLRGQIPAEELPPHMCDCILSLKNDRVRRFDRMIDWSAIVRGGTNEDT